MINAASTGCVLSQPLVPISRPEPGRRHLLKEWHLFKNLPSGSPRASRFRNRLSISNSKLWAIRVLASFQGNGSRSNRTSPTGKRLRAPTPSLLHPTGIDSRFVLTACRTATCPITYAIWRRARNSPVRGRSGTSSSILRHAIPSSSRRAPESLHFDRC